MSDTNKYTVIELDDALHQHAMFERIRTAIGSSTGVTDYELDLTTNQASENYELLTLGAVTWRIV